MTSKVESESIVTPETPEVETPEQLAEREAAEAEAVKVEREARVAEGFYRVGEGGRSVKGFLASASIVKVKRPLVRGGEKVEVEIIVLAGASEAPCIRTSTREKLVTSTSLDPAESRAFLAEIGGREALAAWSAAAYARSVARKVTRVEFPVEASKPSASKVAPITLSAEELAVLDA